MHTMLKLGTTIGLMALSATLLAQNLVVNGSFEEPTDTPYDAGAVFFGLFPAIPGWQLSYGPSIEIMRTRPGGWLPADGQQWTELDSEGQIGIYQDLSTTPGTSYFLRFAFSPRPGSSPLNPRPTPEIDRIRVYWNGSLVATLEADGRLLANTSWTYYIFVVQATSDTTRLEFQDAGDISNGYGAFLDDVSVVVVPEPASMLALGSGLVSLLALRRRRKA